MCGRSTVSKSKEVKVKCDTIVTLDNEITRNVKVCCVQRVVCRIADRGNVILNWEPVLHDLCSVHRTVLIDLHCFVVLQNAGLGCRLKRKERVIHLRSGYIWALHRAWINTAAQRKMRSRNRKQAFMKKKNQTNFMNACSCFWELIFLRVVSVSLLDAIA